MNKDKKQHQLAGLSGFYIDESKDVLPSFEDIKNSNVETVLSDIMEVTDVTRPTAKIKKDTSSS
jgi:hypothetical protein